MNRFNLLKFFTLVLAFASTASIHGQCVTVGGNAIGTGSVGTYPAVAGTLGTSIQGRYWLLGTSGATWSNTCPVNATAASIIRNAAGTDRRFIGNWATGCNATPPGGALVDANGCPLQAGTAITAFAIEQDVTPGTTTHAGNYATSKVNWSAIFGGFTSQDVTNGTGANAACTGGGNCITALTAMPTAQLSTDAASLCPIAGPAYNRALGTGTVCVRFTQLALVAAGGYSGPGAGIVNPITGYEIYQINGVAAPATGLASGWGAPIGTMNTTTDCPANNCVKLMTVTAIPNVAGTSGYFGIRMLYEGGFKSAIMSANSAALGGPLATSGLPSRVEVFNTTTGGRLPGVQVRWTTTNESTIAGFNILASKTQGGVYKLINTAQIAAAGNPNTYLQTISNRTFTSAIGPTGTVYLKLVTVLKDGTTREVGPVSFALTGIERDPADGKGSSRR